MKIGGSFLTVKLNSRCVVFRPRTDAPQRTGDWLRHMITAHSAEIRVRRYDGVPECDVVIIFRGQEIMIRCRDYDQAVKWARIECRSYKVADGFIVER